jgi:alanine racemase
MIGGARLTIDLEALAANYRLIRDRVAPARVGGVVKADGYGLGAGQVARTLIAQGCRDIFVAVLGEAEALAPDLGEGIALYVLNGLMPGTEAHCATIKAIPVLNSLDQIARWSAQAKVLGQSLPAVLQVDTGMSRMGLPADELELLLADPALLDGIKPRLLISHLACADEADDSANAMQWTRFQEIAARFPICPSRSITAEARFMPARMAIWCARGSRFMAGRPMTGPIRCARSSLWRPPLRKCARSRRALASAMA